MVSHRFDILGKFIIFLISRISCIILSNKGLELHFSETLKIVFGRYSGNNIEIQKIEDRNRVSSLVIGNECPGRFKLQRTKFHMYRSNNKNISDSLQNFNASYFSFIFNLLQSFLT